ncbi:MAG TPA: enoyl-CoA hydratase-related protein [Actinomycetota bacterium]|nr:enoyl-CoA hydratase-related protein [Actinomycetota bacterium]
MAPAQLVVERDGPVTLLRMNNPQKLNALSPVLTGELIEALEEAGADRTVRALVLTGEGRGFCAGADLGTLEEPYRRGQRPSLSAFLREGYNRLIPAVAEAPQPVVAAVNGVAAGAGVSLALACDLRVASEEASFTAAFSRIGLVPDSGACYFLPRTLGRARALEFALLSDRVDAQAALAMGLVNRVVPAERLLEEAMALARGLAELPTVALALTRRLFDEAATLSLRETLEREARAQDRAAATRDHLEGVLAFLEKRPPSFTGE